MDTTSYATSGVVTVRLHVAVVVASPMGVTVSGQIP